MNEIVYTMDEMESWAIDGGNMVPWWLKLDSEAEFPSGIHVDWDIGWTNIVMRTNAKSHLSNAYLQMSN